MRLLIAEDEKDLNDIIVKRLTLAGYSVDSCYDGEEAWSYIEFTDYDGIILDIMMPKINGFDLLKKVRSKNIKTPVLFLTAKDTISDRVKGLDIGADDYLIKPFAFEELLARIRVMTRKRTADITNIFTVANLTVDTNKRTVTRGDIPIILSAKEFAILEYMIRNKGIVLSKDKIEQHIWNYDFEGDQNIIKVYMRYLRKKMDDDFEPKLIHTLRNVGYVLREEEE